MTVTLTNLFQRYGHQDPMLLQLSDAIAPAGLFEHQQEAIEQSRIMQGEGLVYLSPTGTGKSLIGEAAVIRAINEGSMALWLTSTRALARERCERLAQTLGPKGIRVVMTSRDERKHDEDIQAGFVDVVVAVYEKAAILMQQNPLLLERMGTLVADEIALVRDRDRGLTPLVLLHHWHHQNPELQIVALGSELAHAETLAAQLEVPLIRQNRRAVPLKTGHIILETGDISFQDRPGDPEQQGKLPFAIPTDEPVEQFAPRFLEAFEGPMLFFTPTRAEALRWAAALASLDDYPSTLSGRRGELFLDQLLSQGIGLHSAELSRERRQQVEALLCSGKLRACAATATLADGINTGVRTVCVFPPAQPYPGFSLANCFGRAGRPGAGPGEAYVLLRRSQDQEPLANLLKKATSETLPVFSSESALAATALLISLGCDTRPALAHRLSQCTGLHQEGEALIQQGIRDGFWEETQEALHLSDAGRILSHGSIDPNAVANWRTMLRRFTKGGSAPANYFLAFGASQLPRDIQLSPTERSSGYWITELTDLLAGDKSPMSRYFQGFLLDNRQVARRIHLAAKATCFYHDAQQESPMALSEKYTIGLGIVEDLLANLGWLTHQLASFAAMKGEELDLPGGAPRSVSKVARKTAAPRQRERAAALLAIDRRRQRATFLGREISLTRTQLSYLETVANRPNDIVSYDEIYRAVWPNNAVQQQELSYYRRALDKMLQEIAPRESPYLETKRGVGISLNLNPSQVQITGHRPAGLLRSPLLVGNFIANPIGL